MADKKKKFELLKKAVGDAMSKKEKEEEKKEEKEDKEECD